jgi:hypothetical protein
LQEESVLPEVKVYLCSDNKLLKPQGTRRESFGVFSLLIFEVFLRQAQAKHWRGKSPRHSNKKGYWSSLRPVPFLNVLCPMAYSSFALSLWSFLRSTLFLFVLIVLRCSWLMSCITECRPSYRMLSIRSFKLIWKDFFWELTFMWTSDLLFDWCDDLK